MVVFFLFNEKKSNVKNSYISAGYYYVKNTKFLDMINEDVFMIESIFEKKDEKIVMKLRKCAA